MLRIRLARIGSKKRPYYRIVVADMVRGRGGNIVEVLGTYDPKRGAPSKIDQERASFWRSKGAAPTDTVRSLLDAPKAQCAGDSPGPNATGDDAPAQENTKA